MFCQIGLNTHIAPVMMYCLNLPKSLHSGHVKEPQCQGYLEVYEWVQNCKQL